MREEGVLTGWGAGVPVVCAEGAVDAGRGAGKVQDVGRHGVGAVCPEHKTVSLQDDVRGWCWSVRGVFFATVPAVVLFMY